MNILNLRAWLQKAGYYTTRNHKRRATSHSGFCVEHLEQRALLSAIMDHGADAAIAEVSVAQKQSSSYPNLAGTWTLTGANGTVFAGSVTFQQSSSDSLTGTISVPGSDATTLEAHRKGNGVKIDVNPAVGEDVHVRGRFNSAHNQITIRSVVPNPAGGKTRVTTLITFDSNSNPSHFTVKISNKTTVLATVNGTKDVVLM